MKQTCFSRNEKRGKLHMQSRDWLVSAHGHVTKTPKQVASATPRQIPEALDADDGGPMQFRPPFVAPVPTRTEPPSNRLLVTSDLSDVPHVPHGLIGRVFQLLLPRLLTCACNSSISGQISLQLGGAPESRPQPIYSCRSPASSDAGGHASRRCLDGADAHSRPARGRRPRRLSQTTPSLLLLPVL